MVIDQGGAAAVHSPQTYPLLGLTLKDFKHFESPNSFGAENGTATRHGARKGKGSHVYRASALERVVFE